MATLLERGVLLKLLALCMTQADEMIKLFFDHFDVVLICHFRPCLDCLIYCDIDFLNVIEGGF